MNEYDLGPNGAQILAADLVAAQAMEVADELHALSGELMVVDTPGQVELFAFREASSHFDRSSRPRSGSNNLPF